jgi:hypothetical protein
LNSVIPLLTFSILLLVPVGVQNVFAHGNIDQENPPPNDALFCGIWDPIIAPTRTAAQEFIPVDSNLVAVDVELIQLQLVSVEPITVNIWTPNIGGNLVGSALINSADLPGDGNFEDIVHVDFAAPIPLVPGNPYFLELRLNAPNSLGDIQWSMKDSNSYPAGTSICGLNPTPDNDFIFRTYSSSQVVAGQIIPIDTTSLLLASAQSFSWMIPVVLSGIGIGLFVVSRKS